MKEEKQMKSELYQNIMGEPEVLAEVLEQRKEYFEALGKKYADASRIYVIGSGTSCHCGLSMRYVMEQLTGLEVTALYPSAFMDMQVLPERALCIGVSQSGRSAMTVRALEKCRKKGWYTAAVSSNLPSPVTEAAEDYIPLHVGIENSASTKGYVVSMENLLLLAVEIGLAKSLVTPQTEQEIVHLLEAHISNLPLLFQKSEEWVRRNEKDFLRMVRVSVMGYEVNYGTALEGALKLLEAVRVMVAGYDFEEWMHGGYNALSPESYLFICSHPGHGGNQPRVGKVARTVAPYNDHHTFIIGGEDESDPRCLAAPFSGSEIIAPFEYIIPFQMMIAILPELKGINADRVLIPSFHTDAGSKTAK